MGVVEDERPTRRALVEALSGIDDVRVVWEAADGVEAVERCGARPPDVLFLDVQMPEMSGFDVLDTLEPDEAPRAVVFVTAYDRYAVRAFDVHAVDYILKPFDGERLLRALDRARERIPEADGPSAPAPVPELRAVLRELEGRLRHLERIPVRTRGRILFVDVDDVSRIEADGNYVRLHAGEREHLVRRPLGRLVARLDPRRFARVHRSRAVNLSRVREMEPLDGGDAVLRMEDGARVRMSRTYRPEFERRMEGRAPDRP